MSDAKSGEFLKKFLDTNFSFVPARVLCAALELGVFSALDPAGSTAAEVAERIGASLRGVRMLLDALVTLEFLQKEGEHYLSPPETWRYLRRESPEYVGTMVEKNDLWERWTSLSQAVRTGKPPELVEQQEKAEEFFPRLIQSLHILHREPAERLAESLRQPSGRIATEVLDVGCGSAVWSLAILEQDPLARATLNDFPGVLEHTRRYVEERPGLKERVSYLPGNLKEVDFGQGRYELAILGNIIHSEGEASSRSLLARLRKAILPQGRVVILDMIPNEERTGPPFPVFFALNMLVHTEQGDTFPLGTYRQWLVEAGFPKVETIDIDWHSPAIVAQG
jgi:SAM-dependent methyltransferase